MAVKPWKNGRWVETFPDGSAQTFRLGTPTEEQRGTAARAPWEDIKHHTSSEWEAMNPKEEPKPEGAGEETPAEETEAPAETPAAPEVASEPEKPRSRRSRK